MEIEEDRFSSLTYGLYRGGECRVSLLAAPHLPKIFFQEVLCKACQAVPGHCLAARSLNNLNYFRLCVLQSPFKVYQILLFSLTKLSNSFMGVHKLTVIACLSQYHCLDNLVC